MTVFLVHEVQQDIAPARQWGKTRYINHRYINGDEIDGGGRIPAEFEQNMANAAKEFNHLFDFLVIAGDHLQLIVFSSMLAKDKPFYNVLRWDRREGAYFPVRIEV